MSGSGGGGYIPPKAAVFDCENGIINTNVSSVDLGVLAKHNIGDNLEVEISISNSLILVDGDGEILGSILHVNTADIIECIQKGNTYSAEIIYINSPSCKVTVSRQ